MTTDQTPLRDRIAEALRTTPSSIGADNPQLGFPSHHQPGESGYLGWCALCVRDVDALAAAVLAVLPATTDRPAVLRAAADDIAVAFGDPTAKHIGILAASWLRRRARQIEVGQPNLRRMAEETPAAETCPTPETHNWGCGCPSDEHPAALGTLPAWLHQRFDPRGPDWDQLDEDDRSYWEHQARAVRRAVARGGFKQPAAGARQDEAEPADACTCGDAGECFRPAGHYADCPAAGARQDGSAS